MSVLESFKDDEKIECFNMISKMFYEKNFGSATKPDIELLMFHFLRKKFRKDTPYDLSKKLGVTQTRINNLIEKESVKYPIAINWEDEFNEINESAYIDDNKIHILIRDRAVFNEVKNAVESRLGIPELTLNKSEMVLTIQSYLYLLYEVSDETTKKQIEKAIETADNNNQNQIHNTYDWKRKIKNTAKEIAFSALGNIVSNNLPVIFNNLHNTICELISNIQNK